MRILIADDQKKLRFALHILLKQQKDLQVIGEAADASELLFQTRTHRPDLVIVSWGLSGSQPDKLLKSLRAICPDILIIILSDRHESDTWRLALAAGADAYASKANPPARLMSIIESLKRHWLLKTSEGNMSDPAALIDGGFQIRQESYEAG
jgi:DNA-binding NarL/FixJ family response regulator